MMETRLKAYRGAMVAALYAALTLGLAPVSYGAVQVRVSEFMTLLAFYDKGLIPGLTLGCLISNVGSPFGITDMLIGLGHLPGTLFHALLQIRLPGKFDARFFQRPSHRV